MPPEREPQNGERRRRRLIGAVTVAIAVLVAVGLWRTGQERPQRRDFGLTAEPEGIMGTTCRLVAVVPPGREDIARTALAAAENVLRRIEAQMSSWLADSEISHFNRAEAGREIALSPSVHHVLAAAREAHESTGGAFDVTVGPLIELWRRSGERNRLPTADEIAACRNESHWDLIELTAEGARRQDSGARVDLGGIAKGYAIDQALEAMRLAGAAGALVDVGGDLRVAGPSPTGGLWRVEVRDPTGGSEPLEVLELEAGAVCTSGDYARFQIIEGRHYSHIIDPRTGRPAAEAVSVTVIGPDAMTADVWATALSVQGVEGLAQVPADLRIFLLTPDGALHRRP